MGEEVSKGIGTTGGKGLGTLADKGDRDISRASTERGTGDTGKAATRAALKNYKVLALGIPWRAKAVAAAIWSCHQAAICQQDKRQQVDKAERARGRQGREDEIC